jgi:hypothetical protein
MKPYIDFNTEQRKLSKNEFEKDLYKLMNNAPFGKTMEDMRNRVNIGLYTDEKQVTKQFAKPQYMQHKKYGENLLAIKQAKTHVKLNKPIYVGVAILDLSKLHMYKFHYEYIKPKYGDRATLLMTDTDSLCYHIETEDIYKDMKENSELFDFCDYTGEGYREKDDTNKKVVGIFKNDSKMRIIIEFCGLRSKMYSLIYDDEGVNIFDDKGKQIFDKGEKKIGKGIKKCALKNKINHDDYKRCILSSNIQDQRQLVTFNNLRSKNHHISLFTFTKIGLSCSNDKQYLLADGITSLSYGHKDIPKNDQ